MDAGKLERLTHKTYLLELVLAGLEARAEHSSRDQQRSYEPMRELANEIYSMLRELRECEITRRLKA